KSYQDSISALSRRVSAVLGDHSRFSITFARHVASNRWASPLVLNVLRKRLPLIGSTSTFQRPSSNCSIAIAITALAGSSYGSLFGLFVSLTNKHQIALPHLTCRSSSRFLMCL